MTEVYLYSKYSQACESFYNKIKDIIDINSMIMICVDGENVRKRILSSSNLKIYKVPCIMRLMNNNTVEIYEGNDAWKLFGIDQDKSQIQTIPTAFELEKTNEYQDFSGRPDQQQPLRGVIAKNTTSVSDLAAKMAKEAEEFNQLYQRKKN